MRHFPLAAVLALLAAPAIAAPAPATLPALSAPLQPLAFLVGWCWRGAFPGGRATDTHCFTSSYGGTLVRDRHVVAGAGRPYSGESLYRWDPASRRISFAYYASDGSYGEGNVAPGASGLDFPDQAYVAPDGRRQTLRSRWTRDGADALLVLNEGRSGDAWRELWRTRWVRAGPAPPAD
jgi:hypothetical protein